MSEVATEHDRIDDEYILQKLEDPYLREHLEEVKRLITFIQDKTSQVEPVDPDKSKLPDVIQFTLESFVHATKHRPKTIIGFGFGGFEAILEQEITTSTNQPSFTNEQIIKIVNMLWGIKGAIAVTNASDENKKRMVKFVCNKRERERRLPTRVTDGVRASVFRQTRI